VFKFEQINISLAIFTLGFFFLSRNSIPSGFSFSFYSLRKIPSLILSLQDSNAAINSLQDFALLQKLFERHGRHADLLSILEDDRLKLKQKLLHDNQEFGRLKMELLFHAKLWEQLFEYSKQVISNKLDESGTSHSSDTDCRPDRKAYESLLMAGNQLSRRWDRSEADLER
jgi:hypothetical protein